MTSKIETTRIAMFDAFTAMKAGGRWLIKKANCETFESALEEHLEELRLELDRWKLSDKKTGEMILFKQGEAQREREQHEETQRQLHEMTRLRECYETLAVDYTKKSVQLEEDKKSLEARLGYALNDREVYSDAYTYQKTLTHNACVEAREYWDRAFHAEREASTYKSDCIQAEALSDQRYDRIQELMEIVDNQRKAYAALHQQKFAISPAQDAANVLKTKAEALAIIRGDGQPRLEAVNRTLVAKVEELTRELDVLKEANKVAGEELRFRNLVMEDGEKVPEGCGPLTDWSGRIVGFVRPIGA